MRLAELGGKEVELERHQAVDHEYDLGNEVNGLLPIILDPQLRPQHSLLHIKLLDLQEQLLILVEVLKACLLVCSSGGGCDREVFADISVEV